jgi:hypothetical protein
VTWLLLYLGGGFVGGVLVALFNNRRFYAFGVAPSPAAVVAGVLAVATVHALAWPLVLYRCWRQRVTYGRAPE